MFTHEVPPRNGMATRMYAVVATAKKRCERVMVGVIQNAKSQPT
jgi:hypothetical protein